MSKRLQIGAEPLRIKTFVQYPLILSPSPHPSLSEITSLLTVILDIPDHSIELERGRVGAVVVIALTFQIDRVMTSFFYWFVYPGLCVYLLMISYNNILFDVIW